MSPHFSISSVLNVDAFANSISDAAVAYWALSVTQVGLHVLALL